MTAEQALANARRLIAPVACAASDAEEEIVVCARKRGGDAYRVPPADVRGTPGDLRGRAGEVPSGSPDRLAGGPCGIFAGERRCGAAEAELYGYGGGKNPVTALLKLGEGLADPDR